MYQMCDAFALHLIYLTGVICQSPWGSTGNNTWLGQLENVKSGHDKKCFMCLSTSTSHPTAECHFG